MSISDPARTILDMLDTPALGGGVRPVLDMLKSYLASTYRNPQLLTRYADQPGNKAVFKRLGYLATTFFPNEGEIVAECRKRLSAGNAKLDPKLPAERLVTAWRLWVSEFDHGAPRVRAGGAKLANEGTMTMNRARIVEMLAERRQEIAARYGVSRLALFGSAARDDLGASSDVDVLVEFAGPATFRAYMDLKFYLEDLLGRPVDLVTDKALREELRPYVEKEMTVSREWRFCVADMKACCQRVVEYTTGLGREDFQSRRMVYDATLRNLDLLGEAARHVPGEARALAPGVPWRRIIGMRNVLIHGYLGIDDDIIWDIVRNEVEPLLLALEKLEAADPGSDEGAKGGKP